jgi:hypothetical protein
VRKALRNSRRTLCEKEKFDIWARSDNAPRLVSPLVCLGQKEIRCHAHAKRFATFDFKRTTLIAS